MKTALFLPLLATGLVAQQSPPAQDMEDELTKLLNTPVVSASKTAQSVKDAPNVISVFAADTLKAYHWETVNDILYKQPGFAEIQAYEVKTVSSRGVLEGWNQNHLLLLVDGVPQNAPAFGQAYTDYRTPLFFVTGVQGNRI